MNTISYCDNILILCLMCDYYVEILLICNFHPNRARDYATNVISKLNNFADVLAVRVHVDVYMATAALRSLTCMKPFVAWFLLALLVYKAKLSDERGARGAQQTLCDTGQRTLHLEIYEPPPTHHQIPPL